MRLDVRLTIYGVALAFAVQVLYDFLGTLIPYWRTLMGIGIVTVLLVSLLIYKPDTPREEMTNR